MLFGQIEPQEEIGGNVATRRLTTSFLKLRVMAAILGSAFSCEGRS